MTRLQLLLACSLPLAALACSSSSSFSEDDAVVPSDHNASAPGGGGGTSQPPEQARPKPQEPPPAEPPPEDDTPVPPSRPLPGALDASAPLPLSILTAGAWDDNANFSRWASTRGRAETKASALPLTLEEQAQANTLWAVPAVAKRTLDVSFVIDTTRSMSDELAYITDEIERIATRIQRAHPDVLPRWSLVVYRDRTDYFLEQHADFDTNVTTFRRTLAAQTADGGGDFPEAPEAALAAMNGLAWRADASTAKIAFWIADAPPHEEYLPAMADAIRGAKEQGVHVYPIASSGLDEHTEYVMRATAQLTGGRYLFLTDDSGVGDVHREPRVPCYYVTKLNEMILRVVDHELTGVRRLPTAAETIRTTGRPIAGSCPGGSSAY